MDEQDARQLAWMLFGDRIPVTEDDEAVVRAATAFILAAENRLQRYGYKIVLLRHQPPDDS
jgi:hypothetical protein